jgi:transcriptional regulator with XRE-family HTH domain
MATKKFSTIRGEVTPERRARLDTIKAAMIDAERLAAVRAGRGMTQVDLARTLGQTQGHISRIESRNDLYLSTLRAYVEALGGELEVTAVFDDERHLIAVG